jgi:hypothetical protein
MFAGSMPKAFTRAASVETATKWRATARASAPRPRSSHARALSAFVIVSCVVKVFDATTNSVSAGSRSRVASKRSVASTFETKRNTSDGSAGAQRDGPSRPGRPRSRR